MSKKIISLVMVVSLMLSLSAFVGAGAVTKDAYTPTYETKLNGVTVQDSLYNIDGNTYFRARTLEKAGVVVGWDEANRVATFDIPQISKTNIINQYEAQESVVRIAIIADIIKTNNAPTTDEDSTLIEKGQPIVIGNGFFIKKDKIITTRDVYETYKYVLGNKNVGTDTGNPLDTIQNITGIKIILSDNTVKEAKNFRIDDDRILGILDTKNYESENIVTLGNDLKVEDMAYMCTSISSVGVDVEGNTTINENIFQVANQWSVNKVVGVREPRDNQYFTIIKNNSDYSDSGRGGAVFNINGELTGILVALEDGNNGDCLVKPVSEIKEFLND